MSYQILTGNILSQLDNIADESIQTVITSPPYWGLRDYGTGTWSGGDPDCKHVVGEMRRGLGLASSPASTRGGAIKCAEVGDIQAKQTCPHCGAIRVDYQLGMEATPEEYVEKIVEAFRGIRRVLKHDGTLWLNIGDSYASSGKNRTLEQSVKKSSLQGSLQTQAASLLQIKKITNNLKQKNLVGIPWRVAFALQADGWYLRQDIIWAKPNPMPESVTDRCTKSHEHIFLLSKSAKYYFDHEAIKEPTVTRDVITRDRDATSLNSVPGRRRMAGLRTNNYITRNKRDVWTIATTSYKGAHFAVFPEKLVEPCILAGSAPGDRVLDPFCGSGTIGVVAQHYDRIFIGIELNPEYITLAHQRIAKGSKLKKVEDKNEQSISGIASGGGYPSIGYDPTKNEVIQYA